MGVRVVFGEAQDPAQAATAPSGVQVVASALVTVDGAAGVFLFERGVVRFQPVEPGERSAATVQILAGLEPGQRVVAEPPFDLKDGDRVLAE
jgi:hypothetical protein